MCQISKYVEERIEREEDKNIAINGCRRKISSQERLVYIKCCIHTRHSIPLNSIPLNCISKYVPVNGQIVVKTCQSGSLKCVKYQDESEVVEK